MKKLLLALTMLLSLTAAAQTPTVPTVMSVGELMRNYGLDTAWVNDTSAMIDYLDQQPQNYVELTNLCVSIRTRAQQAVPRQPPLARLQHRAGRLPHLRIPATPVGRPHGAPLHTL